MSVLLTDEKVKASLRHTLRAFVEPKLLDVAVNAAAVDLRDATEGREALVERVAARLAGWESEDFAPNRYDRSKAEAVVTALVENSQASDNI